jgi:hypothetical protein
MRREMFKQFEDVVAQRMTNGTIVNDAGSVVFTVEYRPMPSGRTHVRITLWHKGVRGRPAKHTATGATGAERKFRVETEAANAVLWMQGLTR